MFHYFRVYDIIFNRKEVSHITTIDYTFKSKVIESGLPIIQKQVSQSLFFNEYDLKKTFTKFSFEEALDLENFFRLSHSREWIESKRINHASFQRTIRLKKRIFEMVNEATISDKKALFLTLTFTDSVLDSTSPATRRRYVSRFLKENSVRYVANKDFGATNGREHYHAVVLVETNINYTNWPYGCLNGQKIRLNGQSVDVKLAKYVSKLTNHAIKETCKRSVLIYSR